MDLFHPSLRSSKLSRPPLQEPSWGLFTSTHEKLFHLSISTTYSYPI
eukprot:CCRYP_008362-RA/>CCRYP_008362-RA protein AED:0.33 eAED:1.00 QI:0/-1/0/1/-1/0/1/0/46